MIAQRASNKHPRRCGRFIQPRSRNGRRSSRWLASGRSEERRGRLMRRRALIAGLGGAAAWPLVGRALAQHAPPIIGFLSGNSSTTVPMTKFFREGLKSEGFVEGQNVAVEFRSAEGQYDKLPALAAE